MNTKILGRWGEEQAAAYLQKKKYKIIGLGYRTRFGEIDILAEKGNFLVFAEVKLRKNDRYGSGREFVDKNKQRRLILTAQLWLSENETQKQPRFDVIEIYAPDGILTKKPEIHHIENAFETEDFGF